MPDQPTYKVSGSELIDLLACRNRLNSWRSLAIIFSGFSFGLPLALVTGPMSKVGFVVLSLLILAVVSFAAVAWVKCVIWKGRVSEIANGIRDRGIER